ncbi:site-specific integrase [Bdellovibrio sp. ZAP7]|uniref:tyrosine-type recombinase/integrase n=1 Tax=Bdellovibrio sp. ZAP7 TaxID=2231053 RepID=UPI0011598E51|nr:site-specific integrase [Bdellovibrio sp. ZAP7]QDK44612.1 site-specific integrase [Bdellovibrio sp. ZAP7]
MGIKFRDDIQGYEVTFSKRHPLTRQPKSLSRTRNDKGDLIATEIEAKRIYNQLVLQVETSFEEGAGGKMKVATLREQFYESMEMRDLAPSTVENYRLCLDAHTRQWNNRTIESIRTEEIRALIKVTLAERSPSHQKSMLKFIKGLFGFAVECGYLQRNPVPMLQFRLGDKIKKVLTREQMKQLLEKAREMNHPWYSVWAFALYTGCRNGELYALTKDKISLHNRTILISSAWDHKHGFKEFTKSKQDRTIEVAPPLIPIIKQLYAENPDSNFVLPHHREWTEGRQAEILRAFLMGIGLPPVRFHDLRASWATALLGNGVEPAKVMIAGGWSDIKTMMIYMRKAGISIKGMTDNLHLHDPETPVGEVISIFAKQGDG